MVISERTHQFGNDLSVDIETDRGGHTVRVRRGGHAIGSALLSTVANSGDARLTYAPEPNGRGHIAPEAAGLLAYLAATQPNPKDPTQYVENVSVHVASGPYATREEQDAATLLSGIGFQFDPDRDWRTPDPTLPAETLRENLGGQFPAELTLGPAITPGGSTAPQA